MATKVWHGSQNRVKISVGYNKDILLAYGKYTWQIDNASDSMSFSFQDTH